MRDGKGGGGEEDSGTVGSRFEWRLFVIDDACLRAFYSMCVAFWDV